jgi:signal transduction histidine kinase/PAS domain-containing protein
MKILKQSRSTQESGAPARDTSLLDSLPVAVWEIDAETLTVSYANRRAVDLFGAEILGVPDACEWARRLFGEDGERLAAALRLVRADGVARRIEHAAAGGGGGLARRFESQVQVSRRAGALAGDLPRTLGVMTAELPGRSGDELNLILQGISDGIIVRGADARLVFANDAAAALCGFPDACEMLRAADAGDALSRLQVLDETGRVLAQEELPGRVAMGGQSVERLICIRSIDKNAPERWTSVRATPVRGPAGEVRYATSVLRDVTPQRRAAEWERFLGEATAVLSSSLDLTGTLQRLAEVVACAMADWCSVDMCRADGVFQRVAAARSLVASSGAATDGAAGASLAGAGVQASDPTTAPRTAHLPPDSGPELYPDLADALSTARASDAEQLVSLRRLGMRSVIVLPLTARGATIGVVTLAAGPDRPAYARADLVVAAELARRAASAVDNARLYADAQEAVQSREDLLAVVSHDLRNPLGVVLTSSALLLKGPLPEDKEGRARRQVEAIQRAGHRMNRLIRDLLDFASIKAGQLSITKNPHDATALVREVLETLDPLAAQKKQHLSGRLPPGPAWISCDRDRMTQVLSNLIGNALKFTPDGGSITVTVEPGDRMVRIEVADTGPGMSTEELQHVFDRYWQARRRNRDGIGLGLSIVKGIVEAHGGAVWAESEVGRGSTFFLTVPVAPARA